MSRKRSFSLALTATCLIAFLLSGGVAEAKRGPSSVTVCADSETAVVSQVSAGAKCVGGIQKWSASKLAPQLCWNASSVDPKSQTRLVSIKPPTGCAAPLRSVPVGKLVLLCADQISGVLRWSVTNACEVGNANTWVRVGVTNNASLASATTTTAAPTASMIPFVSLAPTVITGGTLPKAVVVTSNVAGTVYFAEGAFPISKLSDVTSADANRWAIGIVYAGVATSVPIDVTAVLNGYYRVYVANAQGVLSAPASNIVTISVTRASQVTATTSTTSTTSTTVAVRTQTLDQSDINFGIGCVGFTSGGDYGQLFRAGSSGPLSRVSVGIFKARTVTKISASIYASDGSGAVGSPLATKMVLGSSVPSGTGCNSPTALVNFDFDTPATVVSGNQYIIVLTTPDTFNWPLGGYYLWNVSGATSTGGVQSPTSSPIVSGVSFVFQTYVDI